MLGNILRFLSAGNIVFNVNFSINSFMNAIRVSNSFYQDQARHIVGPDLGPNCLQM